MGTNLICKPRGEVVLRDGVNRGVLIEPLQNIVRVKVSVEVCSTERMVRSVARRRIEEVLVVVGSDGISHLINSSRFDASSRYQPNKISRISRPAAKIGSSLVLCVVSHVKAAEHMAEVDFVTVGQRELFNVFQSRCIGAILLVLIGNIG